MRGHRRRHHAPALGGDRPGGAGGHRRRPGDAHGAHRRRSPPVRRLPRAAGGDAGRRARARGHGTTASPSWWTRTPTRCGSAPIHRVLPRLDPGDAARRAAGAFTVTDLPGDLGAALGSPGAGRRQGDRVPARRRGRVRLLTDPDRGRLAAAMPREASPRWRALDASVMQELLLAQLWSIKDNVRDVLISHDAAEAVRTGGGHRRHGGHLQPDAARRRDGHRGARGAGSPQVHVLRPEAAHRPGAAHLRLLNASERRRRRGTGLAKSAYRSVDDRR